MNTKLLLTTYILLFIGISAKNLISLKADYPNERSLEIKKVVDNKTKEFRSSVLSTSIYFYDDMNILSKDQNPMFVDVNGNLDQRTDDCKRNKNQEVNDVNLQPKYIAIQ